MTSLPVSKIVFFFHGHGCLSSANFMSVYHRSIVYHVPAVITHMFCSNFACKIRLTPQCSSFQPFLLEPGSQLVAEFSYFSTVTQPKHVLILFLFEIYIIYLTGINFHESKFSGENLQNYFFLFSRELILGKKPISHTSRELNLANLARKIFYLLQ